MHSGLFTEPAIFDLATYRVNNLILKAKHWMVFTLFTIGYFIDNYVRFEPTIAVCIVLAAMVLYVGWYVMLGNTLYNYLPRKTHYSLMWFLIDGFLIILIYAATIILFDGNLQATGFAALPMLYVFFAVGHLFWFPAVTLVAIEIGREPEFSEYGGTLLQLVFGPLVSGLFNRALIESTKLFSLTHSIIRVPEASSLGEG